MEMDLYNPDVTFNDPMISFEGVEKYKNNVDMLAGGNLLGKLCFSDCGLTMHGMPTELPGGRLQTRWTLQFRFKLLPWAPVARFTGVSRYTLDNQCRVLAQEDFWDSVNMVPGGDYVAKDKSEGLKDLIAQLAPSGGNAAQQASTKELPYVLLRRAAAQPGVAGYEVRQYPQHVSVVTDYFRRLDAFGTLGAYTNGANEQQEELIPCVPSAPDRTRPHPTAPDRTRPHLPAPDRTCPHLPAPANTSHVSPLSSDARLHIHASVAVASLAGTCRR